MSGYRWPVECRDCSRLCASSEPPDPWRYHLCGPCHDRALLRTVLGHALWLTPGTDWHRPLGTAEMELAHNWAMNSPN